MSTLRIPLIGFFFCAVALLPLAVSAQDESYISYDGTDFSWTSDAQPAEEQSLRSDPLDVSGAWSIAEPEAPAPETGWDYAGFENVEQYIVVPPQELFRPYEALIEPLFDTQGGGDADWADLTLRNSAESRGEERAWFEFNRADEILQAQQLEFEAAQQAADEFNRSDDTLWVEQIAWEARQEKEQAYIDATFDAEATAWQRKGMDELTEWDVKMIQEQLRQDSRDAAAPDREPVPFLKQLQALFAPLPTRATPPTFDERFGNFDADAQYGDLGTDALTTFGKNPEESSSDISAKTNTSPPAQWGFAITDEERLAAETPPDTSMMLSPSDKNSAYYGWLFGTRIPYLTKEWSNNTLEFLDLRGQ